MTKVTTQAMVMTSQGVFVFLDSDAISAINSVRKKQTIDAMGELLESDEPTGNTSRVQIPYSSVLMLQYSTTQSEETVEDANCKVRTPEEESTEPGGDEPGGDEPGGDEPGQ